jgi:hypothetical protein
MASINSYAEIFRDWEELLDALQKTPAVQPILEEERQELAAALAELQALKVRQLELKALRQLATQQLQAAVKRGKEAVMRIRPVVKGKIGPRSELLSQFKVTPVRPRPRKQKTEEKKPAGEAPGSGSSTPESPTGKPAA